MATGSYRKPLQAARAFRISPKHARPPTLRGKKVFWDPPIELLPLTNGEESGNQRDIYTHTERDPQEDPPEIPNFQRSESL